MEEGPRIDVGPTGCWPFLLKGRGAGFKEQFGGEKRKEKKPPGGELFRKGPSPIRLDTLDSWLRVYPNKEAADFLRRGFHGGFRIPVLGDCAGTTARNLKSVLVVKNLLKKIIKK